MFKHGLPTLIAGTAILLSVVGLSVGCAGPSPEQRQAEQERLERERRDEQIRELERGKDEARDRMLNRDD